MNLDWTTIIVALITLVSGGGFGWMFSLKSSKAKANQETESAAVTTLKDALSDIRTLNDALLTNDANNREAIQKKDKKILELTSDLVACQMLICKHDACPFRLPEKGLGAEWYLAAKASGQLSDYTSMQDIVNARGYKLVRLSEVEMQRLVAKRQKLDKQEPTKED